VLSFPVRSCAVLTALACLAFAPSAASAGRNPHLATAQGAAERVVYSFQGAADGAAPQAALLADGRGGFYGTTAFGGKIDCDNGCGAIFHLAPAANGNFVESTAYRFDRSSYEDGAHPLGALVADASGALYATAQSGGSFCPIDGCGAVVKLTPRSGGGFSESVIYSFSGGNDGGNPTAGLTIDARGNLFGTTQSGGVAGGGVAFELSPSHGAYAQRVIHAFGSQGGDGMYPSGSLIADANGNLYGLTSAGGAGAAGTAFVLSPANGGYVETQLYAFTGRSDGGAPAGSLSFGPHGALYGTASAGGPFKSGVVFALVPGSHNSGVERVLHVFSTIGAQPQAGVLVDRNGALYGTTALDQLPACTQGNGCGIAFRMVPRGDGFDYSVLHVFGRGVDGSAPLAGLTAGPGGELFGTTAAGGTAGAGTVFRIE
jgi:hypothetical protein